MRRTDREITDMNEIRAILERARVLHLGLNAEAEPYVVPMHYGFTLADGCLTFYTHCAKEGRKLELLRRDGRVFVEIDTDEALIPGERACAWGAAYACVMARGRAAIVEETEEKRRALALLMKTQSGRDFEISPAMAAAVTVLRIDAEEYSAKARRQFLDSSV
ncbi:MAG: pyridoxamine 5'-phosphate oxidase family protein [Oscillospiraceae bacterium]|nr:pyridoxamine 5'-phosphate oxidase family protein [Oscillospiraceae bacterium]